MRRDGVMCELRIITDQVKHISVEQKMREKVLLISDHSAVSRETNTRRSGLYCEGVKLCWDHDHTLKEDTPSPSHH